MAHVHRKADDDQLWVRRRRLQRGAALAVWGAVHPTTQAHYVLAQYILFRLQTP